MMKPDSTGPEIGRVCTHRYHGTQMTMVVVAQEGGIGYEVNGVVYKSPTAAAKSIVGKDESVNGVRFWGLDRSS